MFIEAMADAAVAQGMPRKQAYQFAAQALLLLSLIHIWAEVFCLFPSSHYMLTVKEETDLPL